MSSCESFLDEKVHTTVTYEDFYKDEADLESAVIAAYSEFQGTNYYDNQIFLIADMSTSIVTARFTNNVYDTFSTDKGQSQYRVFWEGAWAVANAINCVIYFGTAADIDPDRRDEILAEAHFLRALNYFNLIRVYGRIPLVLKPVTSITDDLLPSTVSPSVVYEQIIYDLEIAEEHLPTNNEAGGNIRATKGAATALLGKVYLTMAGFHKSDDGLSIVRGDSKYYGLAYEKLNSVINGEVGTYGLFANYSDVFSNATENGIENIFSIQYNQGTTGGSDGGEGSQKQSNWAPQYGITHTAYETYRIDGDMSDILWLSDYRRPATILESFVDQDGVTREYGLNMNYTYCRKYLRDMREGGDGGFENISARDGEENTIVLRYSDVLLMHSEAAYFKDGGLASAEAIWGINEVKKRANLKELDISQIATQEDFIKQLLNERERELCFEGHLWFDYVRLGDLGTRVPNSQRVSPYKFYTWPIPNLEISKNPNLLQSQGW